MFSQTSAPTDPSVWPSWIKSAPPSAREQTFAQPDSVNRFAWNAVRRSGIPASTRPRLKHPKQSFFVSSSASFRLRRVVITTIKPKRHINAPFSSGLFEHGRAAMTSYGLRSDRVFASSFRMRRNGLLYQRQPDEGRRCRTSARKRVWKRRAGTSVRGGDPRPRKRMDKPAKSRIGADTISQSEARAAGALHLDARLL